MRPPRALAMLLAVAFVLSSTSCTAPGATRPAPATSVSSSPSATTSIRPSPRPTPTKAPVFDPRRAHALAERIVSFGPREATSRGYARAAAFVEEHLGALGYATSLQTFDVPAGTVDGTRVRGGATSNVVAVPQGFDRRAPHVVVGAHLDTVPDSPGANDNASGVAVMLELARLAAAAPPRLPVVFVAFGAEERRSRQGYAFGSRAYVASIPRSIRRSVRGLNIDMVGNGDRVFVMGGPSDVWRVALREAERLDIPHTTSKTRYYSDHLSFEEAGMHSAWLWSGNHPTLHTPRDVIGVIDRRALSRAGRLGWATINALRAP